MKESKESKSRLELNGSVNLKLKKQKDKNVLKSNKMLRKGKDLKQIDKLKKKNGKEKVVSRKLERSRRDLIMKDQDTWNSGKLKKIEKLKKFNVLKNLEDQRLNHKLHGEEKSRSMKLNIKDQLSLVFQTMLSWSLEIDTFKMEELKFRDLLISENMKEDYKLKMVKVKLKDNANLNNGELKKNKSSKELKSSMSKEDLKLKKKWRCKELKEKEDFQKKNLSKKELSLRDKEKQKF